MKEFYSMIASSQLSNLTTQQFNNLAISKIFNFVNFQNFSAFNFGSFHSCELNFRNFQSNSCNKVREVARRRTMMFDDGGMNDETSATV